MPGFGKIFISHALFFAACCGLNIMVTSVSSERAMQFSGMHIHELFALPVSNYQFHVDRIVEFSLQRFNENGPVEKNCHSSF